MQAPRGKRTGESSPSAAVLPWVGVVVLAIALAAALLMAPSAPGAEAPPKFWKKCTTGSGAGQCRIPRGIATDPTTGHLFIADQSNYRVVELSAWGQFIKAWGQGVKDGSPTLQVCTTASKCLAGQAGGEKGELKDPQGVAVDSAGDVYVVDFSNHRIQKFHPDGEFVLMFGANVNKTKVDESAPPAQRNICTEASGDVCQTATTGTGDGEFGAWAVGSFIAADPPGSGAKIYVGDQGRVQEFEPNGSFVKELPLAGETVKSLAVNGAGNLYLAVEGKNEVRKLDASGAELCKTAAPLSNPVALAINPEGGFYAVAGTGPFAVHQFGAACPLSESGPSFGSDELTNFSTGIATGSACFTSGFGLYLPRGENGGANSFIRAYGPVPDKLGLCPRPPVPPSITSQRVVAAQHEPPSTTVEAEINPHFWDDATYYVEYGTGKCSEGGCPEKAPFTPAPLGGGITDENVATAGVVLSGLAYGTTYHYRFVAQSSGGGPVYGGDPDGEGPEKATEEKGTERYFRTIAPSLPGCPPGCLPDNRAYEQVSPTAKGSFDIDRGPVIARPDGEAVLYGSLGAFTNPNAGAFTSMYTAHRAPGGWDSEALAPAADPVQEIANGQVLGVSGDLSKQLVLTNAKLAPEAEEGKNEAVNIYVHDSATDSYQYVDTAFGSGQEKILLPDAFAGASHDGSHFYFVLTKPLASATPVPPPVGELQGLLYGFDTTTGELSYLGVLPGGGVDPVGSFGAGAISNPDYSHGSVAFRAVSEDGSRVYWTHRSEQAPLYLYAGGQSTLVSERQSDSSTQKARLWGASADGGIAIITSSDKLTEDASPAGTDLYRYDANADQLTDLSAGKTSAGGAGVQKVLGVSEDGTYAYFIATWTSGGQPAIYAWHEGDGIRLIGALASQETQFTLAETPNDFWRVSPNGRYLAFLFGGEITGPDPQQSYPVREAYLYDYGAERLSCASCPPGGLASAEVTLHGSRTTGNLLSSLFAYEEGLTRNLTNAGQFFFESKDRLLLADVNGAQDVYQYSAADGKVHLISTGQSPNDSYFGDATPSGSDAFFTTREQLVLQDHDELADLYDARVGGGIASQNEPPPPPCDPNVNCGGPITSPPTGPGPSTPALIGPPDPVPPKCKAGFLRKGNKCVKAGHGKKAKKHKHRHHSKRKRSRR